MDLTEQTALLTGFRSQQIENTRLKRCAQVIEKPACLLTSSLGFTRLSLWNDLQRQGLLSAIRPKG
ncbi:MAG: hypothetical protein ACI82A_000491 [Candidatus Azotimanducaceae bacterium]|jgi:hypothetical protein